MYYHLMDEDKLSREGFLKARGVVRRFLSNYRDGHPDTCWLWLGYKNEDNYGMFYVNEEIGTIGAHRMSYLYHRENYSNELQIDHLCRVHSCVNPDHLEPVTPAINVYRGVAPNIQWLYTKEILRLLKGHEGQLCLEKMLKMPSKR